MVTNNKTIELISKVHPTIFQLRNKDIFGTIAQPLGSTRGAVQTILSKHEEMLKILMPMIISTSTNDTSWYKKVENYWHSFSLKVPIGGVKFEIGFIYDIYDISRKSNIESLIARAKANNIDIKTDEAFMNYVLANVPEDDKYKYATPINAEQYLNWVYLKGHRQVANDESVVDMSTKISFVFIDPKKVEDKKRELHSLSTKALETYIEILHDRAKVKNILYVRGEDASKLDQIDADIKLKAFCDNSPKEFLQLVNDEGLLIKARIERYCVRGILKRLPNSSIIVDSSDTSNVIGNGIDEAVAYFKSEAADKVVKTKEFAAKYKAITETK